MASLGELFVGRGHELAELRTGLEDSLAGRGRLFLVSGEPGIGKTRLAEEFAAEASAQGAVRALWGRCWEGDGGPAFWAWTQCFRSYVEESDDAALTAEIGSGGAVLAELVPEIRERMPALPELGAPRDAEQARSALFDAVSFLRAASRRNPLLLVFDDLHWADQSSLLLLRFLARNLRDSRILILGARRDVELRSAIQVDDMLADLARESRHLALRGLSLDEVKAFIGSTAGENVAGSVAAVIHRLTEGNPFFVAEVVRTLSAESPVEGWAKALRGRAFVPMAVRNAIRRNLGSLSAATYDVLKAAAVIGREFELSCLERISTPESQLLERVGEAASAGLVAQVPGTLDR